MRTDQGREITMEVDGNGTVTFSRRIDLRPFLVSSVVFIAVMLLLYRRYRIRR